MLPYIAEFLGTMLLIILGDGVVANVTLNKSGMKGAGSIQITLAWGLAVMVPAFIFGAASGAHFNPALTIALALDGSLAWGLVPGYIIALVLSRMAPKLFVGIAFDSGGVASGPLTSGFILPLSIGACYVLQGESEIMSCAFGIVAMVAMTPLITIQILIKQINIINVEEIILVNLCFNRTDIGGRNCFRQYRFRIERCE